MNNLTISNPFGVLFFRLSDLQSLNVNKYFDCLRHLKQLLKSSDFKDSVSSFYVNHIANEDDGRISVRLTYFTNNQTKTKKAIHDFINRYSEVKLFPSKDCKENIKGNAASDDPEEELRFRMFSGVYTNIGLDLLGQDILLDFRNLVADYMKDFFTLSLRVVGTFPPGETLEGINAATFFSSFFKKYSKFFRDELDESNREQLWRDLNYCPRKELCFPHFLANMFVISDDGIIIN